MQDGGISSVQKIGERATVRDFKEELKPTSSKDQMSAGEKGILHLHLGRTRITR